MRKVRVAINGYGVIGKRIADAISLQEDMEVSGISDVLSDWRIQVAILKEYSIYAANTNALSEMKQNGINVHGLLENLIENSDIIIDCTPKIISAQNVPLYRAVGKKFIVQGGEKHELTGHSFNSETNYLSALNLDSTRVVSCNTTSILRVLGALKKSGFLKNARGTLLRRATDPWESHMSGIMNTLVPEQDIPSHQGPDAKSVDPDLDVITAAVKVPETLSHVHYWVVRLTKEISKEQILQALTTNSTRIALMNYTDGLVANNSIKEFLMDIGRDRGDMYEVALWQDMLKVVNDELFFAYIVDNQAIVIPENIDAIRSLCNTENNAIKSIQKTNNSLNISRDIFKFH
ncbi:MAG: type II glyceraldehyde-3-phosphate dehydrogenase [Bacteroidetes bacterium]|nr:MAG: type II glyceraldehyde-3-phosphate dehydrogenase [Bacteroidota bacterium]